MHAKDVALLGLSVDIAGAILLARGFMMKGVVDVDDETRTRLGSNLAMVKSAMLQKSEAWGGGVLLFIGFALQIVAALEVSAGTATVFVGWWGLVLLLAISGALFVVAYAICASIGRQRFYEWALRNCAGSFTAPNEEKDLLHHGRLYDVRPKKREPLAAYAARLNDAVAVLRKRHCGKLSLPGDIEKRVPHNNQIPRISVFGTLRQRSAT